MNNSKLNSKFVAKLHKYSNVEQYVEGHIVTFKICFVYNILTSRINIKNNRWIGQFHHITNCSENCEK